MTLVTQAMAHIEDPPGGTDHAPPPPAVVPVAPKTYRELYLDASYNPAPDRIEGYLAGYRFAGDGDIPTPAQLRDQTVALSDRQSIALLCLVAGLDGTPEVGVLRRVFRYVDTPGDEPTGFHDLVLGLFGDILPHQYPAVAIPTATFHLVANNVRVPTVAAMEGLVPAWEDPSVPLGPYAEADADTEIIRPRNSQLVSGKDAAMFIHRRRVNAKQAYQELVGAIRADGSLDSCIDVMAWLRAACTARGGGGANSGVPGVLQQVTPLHLPQEVYQYLTQKVRADLPHSANAGDVNTNGNTASLVGALRALAGGGGEGAGRAARGEVKTVIDTYKETHRVLLRFCNVANAEDVAPLWKRLANCHKSEQQTLITQEMQRVCMERGLSTLLYVPIVTTTLKQMATGLQFPGHGVDDLSTGCQPFLAVAYAGKAHHLQATAASAVADQLAQGDHNATLADIRTIREGEMVKFPLNASEVCVTLARYAVLCQTLFQGAGEKHPFVEAMWKVAFGLKDIEPFVTDKYNDLASAHPGITSVYYARIVRTVQVYAHEYLHRIAINATDDITGIVVPDFGGLLLELTRGTYPNSTNWMDLPASYLETAATRSGTVATHSNATTAPTTVGTTRSGQSTVSSITGGASGQVENTRIPNPHPDEEFASITMRPPSHPPPNNDAGREMCVAWWTRRSACYANCGRRSTHRAFASRGERTRLLEYVREHLAAPAASST